MSRESLLQDLPLVAILRGLEPAHAIDVGTAIFDAGMRAIEVPLNSPEPFVSIRKLAEEFGDTCLCGAGTVLTTDQVKRTHDAGGRLIVSPNCDTSVIRAALQLGMVVLPGIATATEAFNAIKSGARHLKLFPAATYGTRHLKALKDVLPADVRIYPVGGVSADDIVEWLQAGAAGFGFGSELFRPSYSVDDVSQRTRRVVERFNAGCAS